MAVIEAIETVRCEADVSSIDFTSLGSYQHLQLAVNVRQGYSASTGRSGFTFQFNNDTAANYGYVRSFSGLGGTASGTNYTTATSDVAIMNPYGLIGGAMTIPRLFYSGGVYLIMDYRNTDKYKTVIDLNGYGRNGSDAAVGYGQNYWESTAAITSLKVINDLWNPSYDLARGSVVTLYGLNSS